MIICKVCNDECCLIDLHAGDITYTGPPEPVTDCCGSPQFEEISDEEVDRYAGRW